MDPADPIPAARSLAERLTDVRAKAAEAVQAAKAAAPGAAADARQRLAGHVQGLRNLDVAKLKVDRAALGAKLGAKVEALLKARPVAPAQGDTTSGSAAPASAPAKSESEPRTRWTTPFARRGGVTAPAGLPVAAALPSVGSMRRPATRTMTVGTPTARAKAKVRRPFVTLGMLLTAAVTGAILHILVVFGVIATGSGSAYDQMRWSLEPNVMKVLPSDPTGKMALAFLSPDYRYAMCRYDITSGPVTVTAQLPEIGWSLGLYSPQGDNFYAVPGQEGRNVDATFTINSGSDRVLIPIPGQRRADVDANQVTSTSREGLVVVRAPMKGATYQPLLERVLAGARCQAVGRR